MSNVTAPFPAAEKPEGFVSLGVAAATSVFAGALAAINAAGYAVKGDATLGNRILGRFESSVDNSAGSAGDLSVIVKPGIFGMLNSATNPVTIAYIGRPVWVEDDQTVSIAPGATAVLAGICRGFNGSEVWVDTRDNAAIRGYTGAHDADGATLTAAQNGYLYTNLGASGASVAVLPPAVPGLEFNFAVKVAQALRIDPDGTETIELPSTAAQGAAGKYLEADAIGEHITLRCIVAGTWSVVRYAGTWTHQA